MQPGTPIDSQPTPDVALKWLSQHRYEKYLLLAGNRHEVAMSLYVWNSRVAAALLRDLAHVEVAVRNAFDRELSKNYPDWATVQKPGWLNKELGNPKTRDKQKKANEESLKVLNRAQRGLSAHRTHGQVIAKLSFGFWQHLTSPARASTLWTPYLHHAFPGKTQRSTIHEYLDKTVSLRNRLAHLEPVASSSFDLMAHLEASRLLFRELAPEVSDWIESLSDVDQLLAEIPVQGLLRSNTQINP